MEVELWTGECRVKRRELDQTANSIPFASGSQAVGDKFHGQEGKSPRPPVKALKCMLSVEGCGES